ncbi:MAG: aminoglycoside phosphotransferase family protein, partial [Micromonosporaceae bacterium]|nr:aminoglycoside phosphotransferase family protein [Micromonosporaceae bacterium]
SSFRLVSEQSGRFVRDPLAAGRQPLAYRSAEGPREPYHPTQRPAEVSAAEQRAVAARAAVTDFRARELEPLMRRLDVTDPGQLSRSHLSDTLRQLRTENAGDPARLRLVDQLEGLASRHAQLEAAARTAVADLPRAAARDILADRYQITGENVVADVAGARGPGEFSVAGFQRTPDGGHRLVVLETVPTQRTSHVLQDGTRTQRGTPEYLRDVLQTSQPLHEYLRAHPDLLDEVHRALTRGDLTVEYRRVEVEVDQSHNIRMWTHELPTTGLDLHGIADSLPPPTGRPDPLLGARLHEAAQHVSGLLGAPGERHGIARVTVRNDHTLEVQPARGKPYQLEIGTGHGEHPFTVTVDRDGTTHHIEVSHTVADRLDQAGIERLLARAIGHADGEVGASTGGRLTRFFGLHGGRLGGHDTLTIDPKPGRHERLSYRDLSHLGEFEALTRLHEGSTGSQRAAVEHEVQRFIEEHGLREGLPGADRRAPLAGGRLSAPARDLLDQHRVWWRDSDPVVAGTRTLLSGKTFAGAKVEPVPAPGKVYYQIDPEGWRESVRAPFTVEVRSGTVARGVAEFHGTLRPRHFELVVDRGSFDLQGPGRARFEAALKDTFAAKILQQAARPGELPWRLRDRLAVNLPSEAGTATMLGVAHVLASEVLTTKGVASSLVDIATNNSLNRAITMDRVNAEHNRQLAQLPEGHDERPLQDRIEGVYTRLNDLAEALGDPSLAPRGVQPAPHPHPDPHPVPETVAGPLRHEVRQQIHQIDRQLSGRQPIEHLAKVKPMRDDRYRLSVKGLKGEAVARVVVERTGLTKQIEVRFAEKDIQLRVPPELAGEPKDLQAALREALGEAARRQYEINQQVAGLVTELERGGVAEAQQDIPMYLAAESLAHNLGNVIVPAGAARAVTHAIVERYLGHRMQDLADLRERFDAAESVRIDGGHQQVAGSEIVELARNGQGVAQHLLDSVTGSAHPAAPAPAAVASHPAAVDAARQAMVEVNRAHDYTFQQVKETFDQAGNVARSVYKSDRLGFKYDVQIRLTFGHIEDGRAVTPVAHRVKRGQFDLIVNTDADPAAIRHAITHIADNIMYDREHKVPLRQRLYEDFMPVGVRGATAAAVGLISGSIGAGALAGVGAGMHMATRWLDRTHQLHLHDLELTKALRATSTNDVPPESLRERLGEFQEPVTELEQQVRQVEQALAGDPRTAAAVAQLRHALGEIPHTAADLLDGLHQQLGDMPRQATVARVTDAEHTYRVTLKGANGRPETFTFEVRPGHTGDAPLAVHRVDSDVTFAIRVDPTRSPDQIGQAVRGWLGTEIDRAAHQPNGLLSVRGRLLTFTRDTAAQAVASGTSLALYPVASAAGVHVPGHNPDLHHVEIEGGWVTNAGAGAGTTQVTEHSVQAHQAVTDQNRAEQLQRYFGTAPEEQLGVFTADSNHLMDRTWEAYERLRHLEEIAAQLPPAQRPALLQHGPVTAGTDLVAWGEASPEVRSLEQELGRQMFADPRARAAADATLTRLVDTLATLNGRPPHEIEALLLHGDFRNAGQLAADLTSMAEVHQSGNLRMVMTAVFNGVMEIHHPLDLTHTLTRVLHEPGWEAKIGAAGLDVDALRPVRDRLLALDATEGGVAEPGLARSNLMETRLLAGDAGHARLVAAEHAASQGARVERSAEQAATQLRTRADLSDLGTPLHEAEYRTLLAHDRLPAGVTGNPRRYDLPPGSLGPELPVGWVHGEARYAMLPDHPWYQEVVDGHGLPVVSGISGTAGRLLAVFDWLRVPEVSQAEFLHALIGWMLPAGDHSLYELLRGAQLAAPALLGEPGRGFSSVTDMLNRIPGLSPEALRNAMEHAALQPAQHSAPPTAMLDLIDRVDAVRAQDGLLDDNALRRLLDQLPTVPGLTAPTVHSLTDLLAAAHPGAEQRAALLRFAAPALGRDPGQVSLERVGGESAAKGASGAPVFWVRDAAGERVGVVKVFPDAGEFARETAGLARLAEEQLDRLAVPVVRGLGVARAGDASAGVLVASVAIGHPLDDLMLAVRDAVPQAREAAVAELLRGFRDTGAAMAEMHTRPAGSGGPVAEWFADRHATVRAAEAVREWASHEAFARRFGFDGSRVLDRFEQLHEAMRRNPGVAALVHGDPHPGNFVHDPLTGRVTVLDLESMHASMDASGRPVGIAALDVGIFEQVVSAFAHNFDVAPLLPRLRAEFLAGYQEAGGAPLTREALAYYRASGLGLALHGTRRMLFGEAPLEPGVTRESLTLRAHQQLTEFRRVVELHDRPPGHPEQPLVGGAVGGPEFEPRTLRELREVGQEIAGEQLRNARDLLGDPKYWFAKVYHYVTVNELRAVDAGTYQYPTMKLREVVAFHETYQRSLTAWMAGRHDVVEPNWRIAFGAAESARDPVWWRPGSMDVLAAMLPSMQSHIRFDLARAIAAVYEEHYASLGMGLGEFAADFEGMQPVFERAQADLLPEIQEKTGLIDPGRYGWAQQIGMRVIFDVPQERARVWQKALEIVQAHRDGLATQPEVQQRLERYSRGAHPLNWSSDFRVNGELIRDYDWNNQPHPGDARPGLPAPAGPQAPAGGHRGGGGHDGGG